MANSRSEYLRKLVRSEIDSISEDRRTETPKAKKRTRKFTSESKEQPHIIETTLVNKRARSIKPYKQHRVKSVRKLAKIPNLEYKS